MTLSMDIPMTRTQPKGRVLCVDDEPSILRALFWLLHKEFDVVTAGSGQEALALVENNDFDVVISDQQMPEMSGVDLLRQVREIAPRAMRILLTGYSDLQALLRSVNESEIFRYISKPWDITELPRVVAQAAEISRRPAENKLYPACASPDAEPRILALSGAEEDHTAIRLGADNLAPVIHATTIAESIHQLESGPIGVFVSATHLGPADLTRLVCLLKQRHPHMVSVVLADEAATDTVARLINQGQIFRFVPKPIRTADLRQTLDLALGRHRELREQPEQTRRYAVEPMAPSDMVALEAEMQQSPKRFPATDQDQASPVQRALSRISGIFSHKDS